MTSLVEHVTWPKIIVIGAHPATRMLEKMVYIDQYTDSSGMLGPAKLPTIDLDAMLDRIVDAVSSIAEAPNELMHLPTTFHKDGLLGQCLAGPAEFDEDGIEGTDVFLPEAITSCASQLGYHLLDEFKQLKLYVEGELHYSYMGMTNDQSILLWRRG